MPAAIRVEGLSKRFGDTLALRGVSFSVAPGQLVGFLGPNGAGKSTTMRILTGFLRADAGGAWIDGKDVARASRDARLAVGYLPEHNPLYPEMRVETYLWFRARLCGVAPRRRRSAVDSAIEKSGLTDARRRRIGALSKGYRQRVGLAAALTHDPRALILDEPTSGLDPTQVVEARRLLRDLAGERTILLSTHVLSEVERMCARVIVLARGRVRADGSVAEIASASGRRRLLVEARAGAGVDVAAALRAAAGVSGVEALPGGDAGWSRLAALPTRPDADIRESVARACADAGLLVRELTWERTGSLEAAFTRLIESADEADAAEGLAA